MAKTSRLLDCTLPDTHTCLQRAWDVISHKHSVGQVERQLILLNTYLSETGDSVDVRDLQLLVKVMTFLIDKEELNTNYRYIFSKILSILQHPLRLSKSSDELKYKPDVVELFTTLGYLLLSAKDKTRKSKILEIVQQLILGERDDNSLPAKITIQAVELSEFMECLSDFIAIVEEDLYHWSIHTAFQICYRSEFSCWTLLTKGVIESLLVRLTTLQANDRLKVLDSTYQLLWKLFCCTSHPDDWLKVTEPSKLALRSIRYIWREEALIHKDGLPSIAAIILKIIHLFPNAPYVSSGLIDDVIFSATLTEAIIDVRICPYFKNEREHLQYKKTMLACLSLMPISNFSVRLFHEYKVAACLVTMLNGNSNSVLAPTISWTPEHSIDLFRSALPVASALFDCLHQKFIDAGLMTRLTEFLHVHYVKEKNYPENLAQSVIKTILMMCSSKNNTAVIHDALRGANAICTLMSICKILLQPGSSLTICSQNILFSSLYILTALMENKPEVHKKHEKSSFLIVSTLYKRILTPLAIDSLLDNRLIIAICNFAWEVIVWNKENILKFINSGLTFSHLDILERSPFPVQIVYLSMLVDICEYPQSVPYLVTWRGRGGIKLLSVLCKVWREEEGRLGVPKSEKGCVSDIERPLMGEEQYKLVQQEKSSIVSTCDIFGSARPKIYAIVQLLQRHKEVTDLCEEQYKLGHDKVCPEDQVTLQLVQSYLPLKMGEIWWEIRNKQGTVLPLDRYLAETLADRYLNWSLCVQRTQHTILEEQDLHLKGEEKQFYSLIRSTRLTTALEALREVVAIARSADRKLLLDAHRRFRQSIEESRVTVEPNLKVTYPDDSNVIVIHDKTDLVMDNEVDHH